MLDRAFGLSFLGAGSLSVAGFSVNGTFAAHRDTGSGNAEIAVTGSFAFANVTATSASFTVRSDGSVTGAGDVKIGGHTFSTDFSLSSSGRVSVTAEYDVDVSIRWGPSVGGTATLSADTSGRLKATFSGSASYAGVDKDLPSAEVDVADGTIRFKIAGKTFKVKLF